MAKNNEANNEAKKKNGCLSGCLVVVGILAVFGVTVGFISSSLENSDSTNSIREIIPADNSSVENQNNENSGGSKDKLSIDEQVLWEVDGVKVSATGITEDSFWGSEINLLVENDSDKDIGLGTDAVIVNDYMIGDLTSIRVTSGNKSNDSVSLYSSELKAAGIDKIGKVEMYLYTYDPETYDRLQTSSCITITMSDVDAIDTETDIGGTILYDEGGIKIVGQYVDEDSFWGSSVLLYIENNTAQNVIIQNDDLAVNGFMVDSILSQDVYAGKKAIADITLFKSSLEENNITSIDNIETSFRIISEDYDEIANSGKVSFSVQ